MTGSFVARLRDSIGGRRLLLTTAAPAEARAVLAPFGADAAHAERPWALHRLRDDIDLVITGVGKSNAAGAVARTADPAIHGLVLCVGVAGALPGASLGLGAAVLATRCTYADEGIETPGGFTDCAAMGFPLGPFDGAGVPVPDWVNDGLRSCAQARGPIATVSTCSGTDARARQVRDRTDALAEAMEGAAVAHAAARLGLPAGELRVISNTTGDRARQRWDLPGALAALAAIIGRA